MRTVALSQARGTSVDDCVVLGLRFDEEGFRADDVESWVVRLGPGGDEDAQARVELGRRGWYTGLWRSPADRLYVSQSSGAVHVSRAGGGWDSHPLPFVVNGVWGVDDECVFAWGLAVNSSDLPLWQWNGSKWSELPSPGRIGVMGGVSARQVLAVGGGGLVARWDGSAWTRLPVATSANFGALHVVDEGEAYAANRAGELYEISAYGVGLRLKWGAPLLDVAKFQDALWVATGDAAGLYRVPARTQEMQHVAQGPQTVSLQASRDRLLLNKPRAVYDTTDGEYFRLRVNDFLYSSPERTPEPD